VKRKEEKNTKNVFRKLTEELKILNKFLFYQKENIRKQRIR